MVKERPRPSFWFVIEHIPAENAALMPKGMEIAVSITDKSLSGVGDAFLRSGFHPFRSVIPVKLIVCDYSLFT
jgi:hypothetical protein